MMDSCRVCRKIARAAMCAFVLALPGCAAGPSAMHDRLMYHRAMIDFTGLDAPRVVPDVKVSWSPPTGWVRIVTRRALLFTHDHWRSPSKHTGVGVAYVRMPLPLPASAIAFVARQEYSRHSDDGRILEQWTDDLGRVFFEGENRTFHVRGYVVTHGLDAWIVYSGYRMRDGPDPAELSLALRSAQSIVPLPGGSPAPASVVAAK
ncbi:MAG: hypothetical protein ACREJC_18590 [Tepidisphaeraceae bacterium]